MDDTYEVSSPGVSRNLLRVEKVQRGLNENLLRCVASVPQTKPFETSMHLKLNCEFVLL